MTDFYPKYFVNNSLNLSKLINFSQSEFPYLLNVSDVIVDITYLNMLLSDIIEKLNLISFAN